MEITFFFDFLEKYSGAFMALATFILVAITGFYAYWTRGILAVTARQSRLSLNPVIGIKVNKIWIGEVFGHQRRNMSVDLELTNVGNAPAIEVLLDSEIELRYSKVDGQSRIPARFEPDSIPFIQADKSVIGYSQNYGNRLITHFFDDVREALRLNVHRIESDPTKESYNTSRLHICAHYRNSLGQHFKSFYEIEIGIRSIGKAGEKLPDNIPENDEGVEVSMSYVPRPVFHAGVFEEEPAKSEIQLRNKIRHLCGS